MPEDNLLVSSSQSDEQKYIPPPAKYQKERKLLQIGVMQMIYG